MMRVMVRSYLRTVDDVMYGAAYILDIHCLIMDTFICVIYALHFVVDVGHLLSCFLNP
jgi:hypothetical protein